MDYTGEFTRQSRQTVDHLKSELQTIRAGRPSSTLLEGLPVDAYGGSTTMKLMEMASITGEGANILIITPYDQSTVTDIEKAILKSPLGVTPRVEGTIIRVVFPELSSEQREKFIKLVGQKVEEHKVSIRHTRDDIRKKIKAAFDAKDITEDQKFRFEKDIDTAVGKINEEIAQLREGKEKQIREV